MNSRIFNSDNQNIALKESEVHIWNFNLDRINSEMERFENILSNDELARAEKFYFKVDKARFIRSRGLLRILLEVYTGLLPKEINFTFNEYGKPSLSSTHDDPGLHFNLSHSKQFMSVGFVKDALIGVDVELMKPLKDHLEIAKRFFSAFEVEQLLSFPSEKLLNGFYSCWTAKESVIKLSGEGLSYPLKEFDVQLKDLSINESYRYKVNLRNSDENLFVEVFKLQKNLYGACAINIENLEILHCSFESEEGSINNLLNKLNR